MTFYKYILVSMIALTNQLALANDNLTYSADNTEVKDASTGLTWKRCSEGQVFRNDRCEGLATEHNFKGALGHAKKRATREAKWRVLIDWSKQS